MLKFKKKRIDLLRDLVKKGAPSPVKACYGWLLLKEGRLKETRNFCSRDDVYMVYNLALLKLQEGMKEEALELLLDIVEREPMFLGVRRRIAEIALELGEDEVALEHYNFINSFIVWEDERLSELVPEVEVVEETEDESLEEMEEELLVLDEDEEEFITLETVKVLFQQCLFEEALEHLERVLEREPDNEEALELKAKVEEYLSYLTPEEPKL